MIIYEDISWRIAPSHNPVSLRRAGVYSLPPYGATPSLVHHWVAMTRGVPRVSPPLYSSEELNNPRSSIRARRLAASYIWQR